MSTHHTDLREYAVTTTGTQWSWSSQHASGEPGYFLTGIATDTALWRVLRIEADAFERALLTLSPVRIGASLLAADFSTVADPLLRAELQAQHEDLARSIDQHAFRDVVTKAKNIVEGVIAYRMELLDGRDRLATGLQRMRVLLEDKSSRETCGWTDLEYHLAQKLRLLHGQTHTTARVPLRPELALSTVEDLNFLLQAWRFAGRPDATEGA